MANFTEETSLYEILFRVSPDGAWAAQYQTLTEVKRDGVVISATVSDAAPVSLDNFEVMAIVTQLISVDSAKLISENASLREEIEALYARITELETPIQGSA